jgi:hypothetical protein
MTGSLAYELLPQARYSHGEIVLVPLRHDDLALIMDWRNAQMDVLRQDRHLTPDDQRHYWDRVLTPDAKLSQPKQILFSILRDAQCVGYGGLVHIDWRKLKAEVSFLVDTCIATDVPAYRSLFLSFLSAIRNIAFGELGLRGLFTETYDIRRHHVQTLESAGFTLHRVLEGRTVIGGKPIDSLIHELTVPG